MGPNQVSAHPNQVVIVCKIYLVCGTNRDEPSMENKQSGLPADCRKRTGYLDFFRLNVKKVWNLGDANALF